MSNFTNSRAAKTLFKSYRKEPYQPMTTTLRLPDIRFAVAKILLRVSGLFLSIACSTLVFLIWVVAAERSYLGSWACGESAHFSR
jgi:hypothetical protein